MQQEIMVLDDRISAEEVELLKKKQAMKEVLKERRKTKVEVWRDTVVAGCGVTQKAPIGSRSSAAEGDLLLSCEFIRRAESAETQDSVSALPLSLGTEYRGGGREEHGGAELCSECSQRVTLGSTHV